MTNAQGWQRFDMTWVVVGRKGDRDCQVVMVDVYAACDGEQWAARYLPVDQFNTYGAAAKYVTDQGGQPSLRQNGEGWGPLTPLVWEHYYEQAQLTLAMMGSHWVEPLPAKVPQLADEALVLAAGENSQVFWNLEVLPTKNRRRQLLGYSVVIVNHPMPGGALQYEWLKVGQFEDEADARGFAQTFGETGQTAAGLGVAESLAGAGQAWAPMSEQLLGQMHMDEWTLICAEANWHPQDVAQVSASLAASETN